MARRLQEQLRERSGLFQYYDLSNLEPEENNPDHEDNHNPNLRSQPEEEPNRRISTDLQNQEQERLRAQENLRDTMETPVPNFPMASSSATPVPESPIATPSVEENSMNDENAADTASFHTDHASEATDANMEPVYNSIIQENATGNDIIIEDQDTHWPESEKIQAACTSFTFDIPNQQLHRFLRETEAHLDCLVVAAKKSRNEAVSSELNTEEKKLSQAAKQKEFNCWLETKTAKAILRDKIHPSRILAS